MDTERALSEAVKCGEDKGNGFVTSLPSISGSTSVHLILWCQG